LTYLGVAGWRLDVAGATLLVDPYFTRTAVEDEAALLEPDTRALAAFAPPRADVILVGHSHFDHLLDVPAIAARTGAIVAGTESTLNVARAAGVSRLALARPDDVFTMGPFTIRPVRAAHSLTGQPNRPIPADVTWPLPLGAWDEGGTLQYLVRAGGHTIYFVGTANFDESAMTDLRPDIAVVAIGLREKIPDYTCRLLAKLHHPPRVFPNHFDAFREPLRPGASTPRARHELDTFAAEVQACAPGTRVEEPLPLRPVPL